MCWGAYCTDDGDGAFGVTLTYDAPSADTTNARYKEACQTPRNRCSGNGDFNSCDEYPFKQTSDADLDAAVSRCVTTNAQSSKPPKPSTPFSLIRIRPASSNKLTCLSTVQGGKISSLTKNLNEGDQFIVTFGNPGDSKYCSYPPTCDNSDGLEWQNGGPAPSPKKPPTKKRHYYLTARGTEIMSAVELGIGKRITSFEVDAAKAEENVKRLGKRDPRTEYRTVDNEIVEHLFSA